MATLNMLKRTGKRPYRRVGRGQSSTRGKQSGRGGKGQTARAGNKRRPEMRDIIKKLPKRRGYGKNRAHTVKSMQREIIAVSLTKLDKYFDSGAEVSRTALIASGLIGRRAGAKIVGGESSKKFTIKDCAVTASAKSAIEKAGGSILASAPKEKKAPKPKKEAKKAKKA